MSVVAVLVKSTLAPFDCVDRGPLRVMEAEPSIICGLPHGPHARMKSVASICFVLWVIGIPAAVGLFLLLTRRTVLADQRLREAGEGDSVLSNPNFAFRKR